jgi:hypothetical protein
MKNRVYNSTLGKIGRTFGFLLIFFASVVIATYFITMFSTYEGISALLPVAESVTDILNKLPDVLNQYITVMLFVGFVFLIWAIRKGFVIRILLTVLLLFAMTYTLINFSGHLTFLPLLYPEWMEDILVSANELIVQLDNIHEYIVHAAVIAVPILLWYVFANKKPGRISLFLLRIGATFLFLAAGMLVVASEFATSMMTNDLYIQVMISLYTLTYLLFVAGSALGIVGFMKK